MNIVHYPQKSLNKPSDRIVDFGMSLAQLALEMNTVMLRENGIGLAASQIGKNICLIIVRRGETDEYDAYVNPVITFAAAKKVAIEEGCLSIPNVYGFVERASKIRISYQDVTGKKRIKKATGMEAIVLQHEIDHINGFLIVNRSIELTKGSEKISNA